MIRTIVIFSFSVMAIACTDEIIFDSGVAKDHMVVDGFITDRPGPHHIVISRAASFRSVLNGGEEPPIEKATVMVKDDLENVINLREMEPGNYITPASFTGVPGRTYTLHIILDDEKEYTSTPQLLTSSGEMRQVSYRVITNTTGGVGPIQYPHKIEYSIDFNFSSEDQYYKWDWEETYMFPTLCKISADIPCDTSLRRIVDRNVPTWCYVKDSLPEKFVNLAAERDFSTNEIQNHEFEVIDLSFKFFKKHSINMLQYSIGEEAYDYWKLIDLQVNASGSIFDPAPVQIRGNVTSSDDTSEIVLGFFGAFGVTSQRVFIDERELLEVIPVVPSISCPQIVNFHGEGAPSYCDDCRWWGNGLPEKPNFWID